VHKFHTILKVNLLLTLKCVRVINCNSKSAVVVGVLIKLSSYYKETYAFNQL